MHDIREHSTPLPKIASPSPMCARHMAKIQPLKGVFLSLPVELVCRVLSFLPPKDLVRCSQINRFVWDIFKSSSHLKYIAELEFHGLVPNQLAPNIGYSQRLNRLREYTDGWKNLKPKKRYSIQMTENGCVYDFAGGIYANGHGSHPPVSGPLKFHRLPSVSDDSSFPTQTWTHIQLIEQGGQFLDFCMDPTQDLLVMVSSAPADSEHKYFVHIRSLTSNEPHSKAPLPNRPWVEKSGPFVDSGFHHVRIHIVDDIIAILADDGATMVRLSLFNWRSDCDYVVTMDNHLSSSVDDFCLLSRTSFLTVDFNGDLGFYTFTDPALYNRGASVLPPVRRAIFNLPSPAEGWDYWGIILSFNPIPNINPPPPNKSNFLPTPPLFQCGNDDRVLLCTFNLFNQINHSTSSHTLVMRTRVFFESVPLTTTQWAEWGPSNTRWFKHEYEAPWIHSIHGHRIVDKTTAADEKGNPTLATTSTPNEFNLVVRDFNPKLLKTTVDVADKDYIRIVIDPTLVKEPEFKEEITTQLAYREVVSRETYPCSNVMIDDSRIILCQRDKEHHLEAIDVLVF
ncbi:hypothetical protein NEOLEDRAFT_1134601 [Neolentinus lepideus HHB14362 ss-1]|uniref:F-box domain-containing protein n=1 Tax=Neolentinus lepideus HHB14362 ss-1 TaxID=1314782 RepID=A0A165SAW7_9AGAM|nr:hypothetical protein NEOLEDRAFT_1134601 [Neolentinus lepideus HHB14362 ss-1]